MAARPLGMERGRDDGDVQAAHARGLLGGEDDVAVVGQDDDLLGAEGLDGVEQLRGAGIHGLAAVDDGVAAELAEELLVAVAGDDGDDDGAAPPARRAGREALVARARLLRACR